MNIANSSGVQAATAATQSAEPASSASVLVLKKALDAQASAAMTLLEALPQAAPALADSGTLGRHVNAFA